jgi:hypothetical protein
VGAGGDGVGTGDAGVGDGVGTGDGGDSVVDGVGTGDGGVDDGVGDGAESRQSFHPDRTTE